MQNLVRNLLSLCLSFSPSFLVQDFVRQAFCHWATSSEFFFKFKNISTSFFGALDSFLDGSDVKKQQQQLISDVICLHCCSMCLKNTVTEGGESLKVILIFMFLDLFLCVWVVLPVLCGCLVKARKGHRIPMVVVSCCDEQFFLTTEPSL
jgi:hypothetical protein